MRKLTLLVAVITLIGSTAAFAQDGTWRVRGAGGAPGGEKTAWVEWRVRYLRVLISD